MHCACNMFADGYWKQIRAGPDIQQPLLQYSGRGSGWVTKTYKHRQLNTNKCLSQWALREVLQCAIYSAERQHLCFWQLAVVTTLLLLKSWQHTQTYICKQLRVNTNLNKGSNITHSYIHQHRNMEHAQDGICMEILLNW